MSDATSSQRVMAGALHHRCTGGPGCDCVSSDSPSDSSPGASPSRSRSTSLRGPVSGDSSFHLGTSLDSESDSTDKIPPAFSENEWSDLKIVRIHKCHHDRHAVLKKVWGGKHTGRRFLGCPMKDPKCRCEYIEWVEDPWPERVQKAFKSLWKDLKITRHIEGESHVHLIEALQHNEEAKKETDHLNAEVEKAASVLAYKNKLMKMLYCLIGVIALQSVGFYLAFLKKCSPNSMKDVL